MEDYEIIQRCLAGDKEIFAELVRRYKNLVYSIVLRSISDSEEADDVSQEVFIKMYRYLDKYEPIYKYSTWVMKITTNTVIDYHRKKKMQTVSLEEANHIESTNESPEKQLLEKENKKQVVHAVDELDEMYRTPIVLFYEKELSYQEIADTIDEPLSKVKNRIFRAKKILKEKLSQEKGGRFI